jgi:hypothetical protein
MFSGPIAAWAPRVSESHLFFGLFHGLGFAGGLLAVMSGMPGATVGLAIVAFSAGVEIGHQCVVLPIFGLTKLLRLAGGREHDATSAVFAREWLLRGGSAMISVAGYSIS